MRTVIFFLYLWGYMLLHPFVLLRGKRALKRGDFAEADRIAYKHVPVWAGTLLKLAGCSVTVTGEENIPKDRPCVFAANHRSYFDIALMLTQLGKPIPLISKIEIKKLPLIRTWMELLHCLFLDRSDPRQSVRVLDEAQELIEKGYSIGIFPEGTRWKGEEGGLGTFQGGAFRIAYKTGAPIVPVVLYNTRACLEATGRLSIRSAPLAVHILPPVETAGKTRAEMKELPAQVEEIVRQELAGGM